MNVQQYLSYFNTYEYNPAIQFKLGGLNKLLQLVNLFCNHGNIYRLTNGLLFFIPDF